MSLTERIASDLINAMKAKDKVVLEAIRAAKTAFTLARTEKNGDTVLTAEEELTFKIHLVPSGIFAKNTTGLIYMRRRSRKRMFSRNICRQK